MKFRDREIEALNKRGYLVEQKTQWQFRIESVLDLYPRHRRFHNIANQSRGEYPRLEKLVEFVDAQVAIADRILDEAINRGQLNELRGHDRGTRKSWLKDHQPWFTKYGAREKV